MSVASFLIFLVIGVGFGVGNAIVTTALRLFGVF